MIIDPIAFTSESLHIDQILPIRPKRKHGHFMSQSGELVYQIVGTSANLIWNVGNNISYSHGEVLNQPLVNSFEILYEDLPILPGLYQAVSFCGELRLQSFVMQKIVLCMVNLFQQSCNDFLRGMTVSVWINSLSHCRILALIREQAEGLFNNRVWIYTYHSNRTCFHPFRPFCNFAQYNTGTPRLGASS